ncbi:YscQ/HrcQ family type III secretion apparatus protein [Shewanella psychropiezotolerans]|uniref:YscQ/HrcQ family type III secretion apparatus protein n=1 Tax=Shewanella psychropiezotolerans TaxID=2593655 RepID=A0ABX5X4S7_9GAMM|nr:MULTISPECIES: type III secretion system cytoplasmic ring protein SctQ [Shewanella]MPY25665.1 YscQ/HrcQ family type III secretion apparatus protein [Shewanella sp. YLB-07]QDO86364.1 YscQ/HrcQ family type III secretion apparatus protein [Shewanella psychropiezotolerans]
MMLNLPLPSISAQELELNNRVYSRQYKLDVDEGLSIEAGLAKRPGLNGYELEIFIGSSKISCLIQADQIQACLADLLISTPFAILPELLQLEFITAALTPYQAFLTQEFGQQLVLSALKSVELSPSQTKTGFINFIRNGAGLTCWIENDLKLILSALPAAESVIGPSIQLPLALRIGHTSLSLDQAKSLEHGDIIFFDSNHLTDDQAVLIIANQPIWRCGLIDNRVTITAPETEKPMSSEATDIQSLPINISFEIGEQTVTVAELSQLQENFVFELANSADQAVKLKANGQVLATGELVKINEHLGVRITKLTNQEIS